ncbi:MAG: glycoside hydrolase family 88 protein [Bacilli bacterium]|nr:glycoside hydrolase family 88 protein [Bacilli bacterium]
MVEHYIDQVLSAIFVEKNNTWTYEDGFLRKAIFDLYRATNKEKYYDFVVQYYQELITEEGKIKHRDVMTHPFVTLLPLFDVYEYTELVKYKIALDELAGQIALLPRNEAGILLDAMGQPLSLDHSFKTLLFYAKYANLVQDDALKADVKKQFLSFFDRYYNSDKQLFLCHGTQSSVAWLGGMGYLAMSLVEVLSFFPDPDLITLFQKLIDGLDGAKRNFMWYQIVDKPNLKENYIEVGGSLMLCYAYLQGTKIDYLSQKYYVNGIDTYHQIRLHYFSQDTDEKEEWHLQGIHPYKLEEGIQEQSLLALPADVDHVDGLAPFILIYAQLKKAQK